MSKIDSDVGRFKDIIRGKVKNNLKHLVGSDAITGQVNGKIIKVPLHYINIPRFSFGGGNGGAGSGPGDAGDPMDGNGKPGAGKAGDDEGQHEYTVDFEPDDLANLISEELSLPKLLPKGKASINTEKHKFNTIANEGSEGLRHLKKTFKETMKRDLSSGTHYPGKPMVPIKSDKRYKSYSVQEKPEISAIIFFLQDVSGSMQEEQKKIAKNISFWIELLLKATYKNIETVYIAHDTTASELSKEQYYKADSSGGTKISSAYQLCFDIIESRYPFASNNNYIFQYTDGDSYAGDNDICASLLRDRLLVNCNQFAIGQIKSSTGSSEYIEYIASRFTPEDNLALAQINTTDDILSAIKSFFEKGL